MEAMKHPVPDRVKPFVICNFWHWASECPDVKNYKWRRLNPVWHRTLMRQQWAAKG